MGIETSAEVEQSSSGQTSESQRLFDSVQSSEDWAAGYLAAQARDGHRPSDERNTGAGANQLGNNRAQRDMPDSIEITPLFKVAGKISAVVERTKTDSAPGVGPLGPTCAPPSAECNKFDVSAPDAQLRAGLIKDINDKFETSQSMPGASSIDKQILEHKQKQIESLSAKDLSNLREFVGAITSDQPESQRKIEELAKTTSIETIAKLELPINLALAAGHPKVHRSLDISVHYAYGKGATIIGADITVDRDGRYQYTETNTTNNKLGIGRTSPER